MTAERLVYAVVDDFLRKLKNSSHPTWSEFIASNKDNEEEDHESSSKDNDDDYEPSIAIMKWLAQLTANEDVELPEDINSWKQWVEHIDRFKPVLDQRSEYG